MSDTTQTTPVEQNDIDDLLDGQDQLLAGQAALGTRVERIETRLVRLMQHFGLNQNGDKPATTR